MNKTRKRQFAIIGSYKNNIDIIRFWCLAVFSIIVVYGMPFSMNYIYFGIIIYNTMFSKSKNDYFWIAFWFLLLDFPSDLFLNNSSYITKQLPFLPIPGSGMISLRNLVPGLFLFKAIIVVRSRKKIKLHKDINVLLILFIFYLLLGLVYGMSRNDVLNTVLIITGWTMLISFSYLISYNTIDKLDRLLFTVVFVAFASQLFSLLSGYRLIDFVMGTIDKNNANLLIDENLTARILDSPYILIYSLHKAYFYLISGTKKFSIKYCLTIIIISFISIFLSATRGWILASFIVLILSNVMFWKAQNYSKLLKLSIAGFITIVCIYYIAPILQNQIRNSYVRFKTVEEIATGKTKIYRQTTRAPYVISGIRQKPIFGWGFGSNYWHYRDRHIGQLVVLLNCGIIGFIIINYYFIKWFVYFYNISTIRYNIYQRYGYAPRALALGLVFGYVIHSTSHMFWGYDLEIGPTMYICMLFANFNIVATETPFEQVHSSFNNGNS